MSYHTLVYCSIVQYTCDTPCMHVESLVMKRVKSFCMLTISIIASIAAIFDLDALRMGVGMYFATSCNGFDGEGCEVCFWDRRQMKLIWQCKGHQQATKACVFLPTASTTIPTAATSEYDILQQDTAAAAASDPSSLVHSGCPGDCGGSMRTGSSVLLASASADGTVKVWEMGRHQPVCTVTPPREGGDSMMTCLAVCSAERTETCCNATNNLLFASNFHGQLHSWGVQQLCFRQTELEHKASVQTICPN